MTLLPGISAHITRIRAEYEDTLAMAELVGVPDYLAPGLITRATRSTDWDVRDIRRELALRGAEALMAQFPTPVTGEDKA